MADTPIMALIVDDEPNACKNLERLLDSFVHNVQITAAVHNTAEAEKHIQLCKPDVLFLDIQMPNENAFQFLERLEDITFEIIFVTAYDEFAIRAFKLNAVDYILKPIDVRELQSAVTKLRERISFKQYQTAKSITVTALSQQINKRIEQQQLVLKSGAEFEIVPFKNILYLEAMGSYAKVIYLRNGQEKSSLMARAITEYEELLPPGIFIRVHKSYLINCSYIKKIIKDEHTSIQLSNDMLIPVARRRYKRILDFLQGQDLSFNQ